MWIEREIASELVKIARAFPALVLVGPRQVGKTSLLERTFPDYRYVSLDLASNAESAETRPADFLAANPPPLIVDEVQYAPALFRHLKAVIDRRRRHGQFLLTGSQNFMLMQAVSDSLAGRAAVIPLLGLSAAEWASAGLGAVGWPEFLWRGSYPALWAEPDLSRNRWYQGYLATYLERDVRNILRVESLRDFERFLRACATRIASTLNMSDLARDVGISPTTARQWIGVLHASNQVVLLEPYHRSLGKRLAKSPKLYFSDTGLAAFLLGLSSADEAWQGRLAGALWENHVVGQWLRWRDWRQPSAALWYWRDQAGREVDIVIELGGRIHPVECKLTQRPDAHDAASLRTLRTFYGAAEVGPGFIACPIDAPFEVEPHVTAVSGWRTWEL
jgi:uncharacterized protein